MFGMTGASETTLNPHPAALVESLRSIGYTLDTALADIIDNSISADASNISVRFLWNSSEPWLAIADDGHGMLPEDLTCAMRFGSSSPLDKRAQSDLGRFGLGMKTASISQCRQLTVISKKDGILSACEWDLDRIAREESDQWRLVHLGELDLKNDKLVMKLIRETLDHRMSGTIVLWRNLVESLRGDGSASTTP